MSLSRFNKGIVGSYPATKDQRRLREARSRALAILKQRALDFQAKYRREAVQRRIDHQVAEAAVRRLARKEQND